MITSIVYKAGNCYEINWDEVGEFKEQLTAFVSDLTAIYADVLEKNPLPQEGIIRRDFKNSVKLKEKRGKMLKRVGMKNEGNG